MKSLPKSPLSSLTDLYTAWWKLGMTMFTGRPTEPPKEPPTPKAEQAAANQEWEAEGGSVKAGIRPAGTKPAPKLPH